MNKRRAYRVLFTIFVIVSLVSNRLPFLSASQFGFSIEVNEFQLFDAEWIEFFLDLTGNSEIEAGFSVLKFSIIAIMGLDIVAIMGIWAKKKVWAMIGIGAGLADCIFHGFMVVLCSAAIDEIGGLGLSVGFGLWGHIFAGIGMIVVAIMYCCCKEEKTVMETSARAKSVLSKTDTKSVEGALIGVSGEYAGAKIPVGTEPVFLGRDIDNCHIIFKDVRISAKHCSIEYDLHKNVYIVKDFSKNGTFVNNTTQLPKETSQMLGSGEEIRIGEEVFCLK